MYNALIVILGFKLNPGGVMTDRLERRLERGLLEYKKTKWPILVSGGTPVSNTTEAEQMSKWLLKEGVSKDKILLETDSNNTVENAIFCNTLFELWEITKIILITSPNHYNRAKKLFQHFTKVHICNSVGRKLNGYFKNKVNCIDCDTQEVVELPMGELVTPLTEDNVDQDLIDYYERKDESMIYFLEPGDDFQVPLKLEKKIFEEQFISYK